MVVDSDPNTLTKRNHVPGRFPPNPARPEAGPQRSPNQIPFCRQIPSKQIFRPYVLIFKNPRSPAPQPHLRFQPTVLGTGLWYHFLSIKNCRRQKITVSTTILFSLSSPWWTPPFLGGLNHGQDPFRGRGDAFKGRLGEALASFAQLPPENIQSK